MIATNSHPLAEGLLAGQRRALARAITLAESSRPDHRASAEALLAEIMPQTGKAVRLGLSGAPGVGKSTFIEAFGLYLIGQGHKVAVLAVDPSSQRTGGSILGDKTRMEELSRAPNAFIRPSPAGRTLGGVARRTHDSILLVEAAGFDVVLVETVGVGQSETAVAELVDSFLLLLPPAGGDELQGIKKGVVELADLAVVNKADGDLVPSARRAAAEYQSALRMLRPAVADWIAPVIMTSALKQEGMDKVWEALLGHRKALGETGLAEKRAAQARSWFWSELREGLVEAFQTDPAVAKALPELEAAVTAAKLPPSQAAKRLLDHFRGGRTQG
ncbi:MAG: methylmalonyl Co-A mutase-associated GTPase MeaB [Pseudomonadota bacterium]